MPIPPQLKKLLEHPEFPDLDPEEKRRAFATLLPGFTELSEDEQNRGIALMSGPPRPRLDSARMPFERSYSGGSPMPRTLAKGPPVSMSGRDPFFEAEPLPPLTPAEVNRRLGLQPPPPPYRQDFSPAHLLQAAQEPIVDLYGPVSRWVEPGLKRAAEDPNRMIPMAFLEAGAGAAKGLASLVSGLTSPLNVGVGLATMGASSLAGPVVGRTVQALVSGGFGVEMISSLKDTVPGFWDAVQKGDVTRAAEMATGAVAAGVLGTKAVRHGVSSGIAIAPTRAFTQALAPDVLRGRGKGAPAPALAGQSEITGEGRRLFPDLSRGPSDRPLAGTRAPEDLALSTGLKPPAVMTGETTETTADPRTRVLADILAKEDRRQSVRESASNRLLLNRVLSRTSSPYPKPMENISGLKPESVPERMESPVPAEIPTETRSGSEVLDNILINEDMAKRRRAIEASGSLSMISGLGDETTPRDGRSWSLRGRPLAPAAAMESPVAGPPLPAVVPDAGSGRVLAVPAVMRGEGEATFGAGRRPAELRGSSIPQGPRIIDALSDSATPTTSHSPTLPKVSPSIPFEVTVGGQRIPWPRGIVTDESRPPSPGTPPPGGPVPPGGATPPGGPLPPGGMEIDRYINYSQRNPQKPTRLGGMIGGFYTDRIDQVFPIQMAVDDMSGREKVNAKTWLNRLVTGERSEPWDILGAADDPANLVRLNKAWSGIAQAFLEQGVVDYRTKAKIGPSLEEAFAPLGGDLKKFDRFMTAQHAIELHREGKEALIPLEVATATRDALMNDPALQQSRAMVRQVWGGVQKYLIDSGVGSTELFTKLNLLYPDYVHFNRFIEGVEVGSVGSPKALGAVYDPVRRISGESVRPVISPSESFVKDIYLFVNLAEKNRIGRSIENLVERTNSWGQYVQRYQKPVQPIRVGVAEVLDRVDPNLKTQLSEAEQSLMATIFRPRQGLPEHSTAIPVFENGQAHYLELHPDLFRAYNLLDGEVLPAALKWLAAPARGLRVMATSLSTEFPVRNVFKDQWTAFVQSRYGFIPGVDAIKGLYHWLGKDETYWLAQKSGAMHGSLVSLDRDYMSGPLRQSLGRSVWSAEQWEARGVKGSIKDIGHAVYQTAALISEIGEEATRLGEFAKAIKKEGTSPEGLARAAAAAREVTVDFQRIGGKMQAVNALTAFYNARIQGIDKMRRTFIDDPRGASLRAVIGLSLPSAILWAINHNDPRYQELDQRDKDQNFIIMTPNHIWRIPKPFEMGVLFGTAVERALDWTQTHDPEAFKGMVSNIWNSLTPGTITPGSAVGWQILGGILPTPTAMVPVIETFGNRSQFTGKSIIPPQTEKLDPALQRTEYTTDLFQKIGEKLDYSPAKLENILKSQTAFGPLSLIRGAEWGLQKIAARQAPGEAPEPLPIQMADLPLLRGLLVRYPSAKTQSIEDFYEMYRKIQQVDNSYKQYQKDDLDKAIAYGHAHENEIALAPAMVESAQKLTKWMNYIRDVKADRKLSGKEKQVIIDETYRWMQEGAAEDMKAIRDLLR